MLETCHQQEFFHVLTMTWYRYSGPNIERYSVHDNIAHTRVLMYKYRRHDQEGSEMTIFA